METCDYRSPSPLRRNQNRSGALLVVVVALTALLAVMATTVLIQVKSDAQSSRLILQDAQARVTLTSALHYIVESSRLGWGQEARGWVDVRTGQPGPMGPSLSAAGPQRLGWTPGGPWPAPGSVYRGDLFTWRTPPYGIDPRWAPNPLTVPKEFPSHGNDDAETAMRSYVSQDAQGNNATYRQWHQNHHGHWYDAITAATDTAEGAWGVHSDRPLASTWTDFQVGNQVARPESVGLTWFRIYREDRSDHDGDGNPWYDQVDYTDGTADGYHDAGIFIITVAAGSTRGFRFWNSSSDFLGGRDRSIPANSYSNVLEPTTASASGLFANEAVFRSLRAQERMQWYRVRWTPRIGGRYNPYIRAEGRWPIQGHEAVSEHLVSSNNTTTLNALMRMIGGVDSNRSFNSKTGHMTQSPEALNLSIHHGGSIAWIQRLDQEPPKW